jgi:hypothetical protein
MCKCHDAYYDEAAGANHHLTNNVAGDQCHDEYETIPAPESVEHDKAEIFVISEPVTV